MSVTAAELWALGATDLAEAIRSKRVTSREVMESHLRRIDAVNSHVNAIPVVMAGRAIEAADTADRLVAAGADLPALHGVPFTVKSNIDVAGTPTTHGMKAFATSFPTRDAPAVERLKAAGAIPIGRTNMPDYAISWHTDSELYGPTVNPWDRRRTPGGSSGGEGVALATGMSPLGLGNDTLGSLRWPAQCSGVCALKPSLGRIPDATSVEPAYKPIGIQLATANGPMARTVADLRIAFRVLAGPVWRDPWSVPAPLDGPPLAKPIRVAAVFNPAGQGTAAQVERGVRDAAAALEEAGYEVDETEPPSIELAARTLLEMLDMQSGWRTYPPPVRDYTSRWVAALFDAIGDAGPSRTSLALMVRHSLMQAWGEFQESHPLIVAPIATDIPFEVGLDRTTAEITETLRQMRMVMAVNTLGLPALAVPVGVDRGLPQGVQLIAPRYREDLCLDAAEAIEERLGTFTPIDPR